MFKRLIKIEIEIIADIKLYESNINRYWTTKDKIVYPKTIEIKKYGSTLFDLFLVIIFPNWNKRFNSVIEKNKLIKKVIH